MKREGVGTRSLLRSIIQVILYLSKGCLLSIPLPSPAPQAHRYPGTTGRRIALATAWCLGTHRPGTFPLEAAGSLGVYEPSPQKGRSLQGRSLGPSPTVGGPGGKGVTWWSGPSLHSGLSCTTMENGPWRGVGELGPREGLLTGVEAGEDCRVVLSCLGAVPNSDFVNVSEPLGRDECCAHWEGTDPVWLPLPGPLHVRPNAHPPPGPFLCLFGLEDPERPQGWPRMLALAEVWSLGLLPVRSTAQALAGAPIPLVPRGHTHPAIRTVRGRGEYCENNSVHLPGGTRLLKKM